jgi:hypothetical protein
LYDRKILNFHGNRILDSGQYCDIDFGDEQIYVTLSDVVPCLWLCVACIYRPTVPVHYLIRCSPARKALTKAYMRGAEGKVKRKLSIQTGRGLLYLAAPSCTFLHVPARSCTFLHVPASCCVLLRLLCKGHGSRGFGTQNKHHWLRSSPTKA